MSDPENPETTDRPDLPEHTPHAPHPPELRERAFELHCQFQSNAAISRALGVPERTVRSWVSELLAETTGDLKKHRYDALCEAVASQRAIAAAAWNAFNLTMDHERARLAASAPQSPPLLWERGLGGEVLNESADEATQPPGDIAAANAAPLAPPSRVSGVRRREDRKVREAGQSPAEPAPERRGATGGVGSEPTTIYRSARLLLVAFAAQREISQLLRLYEDDVVPREPIEILITRNPPWPEPDPSDYLPEEDLSDDKNDDPPFSRSRGQQYRHWNYPTNDHPPASNSLPWPEGHVSGSPSPRAGKGDEDTSGASALRRGKELGDEVVSGSPLPVGHDGARTARSEERGRAARSRRESEADGPGERSLLPGDEDPQTAGARSAGPTQLENSATPATPSPTDTAPSDPQPPAPPSGPEPERLPYPVAWLFPPGAPIPRPYRNAPPRPDRVFWNNPCRW